jgi:ABC-type transporter Mla subunit MlaD
MKALSARATDTLNASSSLLVHAEKTLPKVDGILDSTDRLLHHVEKTLPKVDGVLNQARDVAQSANALVGRTQNVVEDGSQIVEDASKITKGAMRSWPFSSWAPKASERMVPIDSQDNAPSFMEPISKKGGK